MGNVQYNVTKARSCNHCCSGKAMSITYSVYEGWNFNSGNYLFTTDTK